MKYKTFIAKALIIGIVLNSISTLSYANTEIPNRYQTLEGKYITVDDSTEGNLEEIEIFGNTVQNPDNLEEVQSVGDLYVDENGNPILDSQGREQYKIDIVSSNSNLNYNNKFYAKSIGTFSVVDNGYKVENTHNQVHICYDIPLNGNTQVTVKAKLIENSSNYNNSNATLEWWVDDKWGGQRIQFIDNELNHVVKSSKITSDSKVLTLRIGIGKGNDFDYGYAVFDDISLAYGDTTHLDFEEPMEYKTTILLPCQLQKVGDIADRLYWDNEKGRYVIEKNISNYTIDDSARARRHTRYEKHSKYQISVPNPGDYHGNFHPSLINGIVKGYPQQSNSDNSDAFGAGYYFEPSIGFGSAIFIKISNTILDTDNENEIKRYLETNNLEVMYKSASPELIETNITSKLKIPTYDEKTYIYIDSENNINPTLKVTVDRLPQIAKEAVAQAESDSSINNISLARMYTNMLPESLYKDQLQAKLNEIFNIDELNIDRKNTTANTDVYIKPINTLIMSLNTNNITFEDFSGVEDTEKVNAVEITINSSLPYSLNAYLPTEIQNADKTNIMDKRILNIKENSESVYQAFANTTDKIVLKDNCNAGNDLIHNIDIKLKGGIAHQKDVYKTTIKFEAQQK